jgi:hypothetical protein
MNTPEYIKIIAASLLDAHNVAMQLYQNRVVATVYSAESMGDDVGYSIFYVFVTPKDS